MFGTYLGVAQGSAEGGRPLHVADVEVLLDALRNPDLRERTEKLFERAVAKGESPPPYRTP
jgi:hypothetical protein